MEKSVDKKIQVSSRVPKTVKNDILELVYQGEYSSVSDFVRNAVLQSVENHKQGDDVLNKKDFHRFIEKIS